MKSYIDTVFFICYTEPVITVKRYTHLKPIITTSFRMLTENAEKAQNRTVI